ncbi:MAG: hypothetical protein JWR39_2503 [Devosia sp.]|nr:hypothetical protein [Devosia sp.]
MQSFRIRQFQEAVGQRAMPLVDVMGGPKSAQAAQEGGPRLMHHEQAHMDSSMLRILVASSSMAKGLVIMSIPAPRNSERDAAIAA